MGAVLAIMQGLLYYCIFASAEDGLSILSAVDGGNLAP